MLFQTGIVIETWFQVLGNRSKVVHSHLFLFV